MQANGKARRQQVAIVPEWYPSPSRPVLGTFVREQARAIAPYADVAVVYCDPDALPRGRRSSFEQESDDGLLVVRIGVPRLRPRQLGSLARVAAVAAALADLGETGFSPDVIHAHVFSAAIPALWAGWRLDAPVVVTEHYTGISRGNLSPWDRIVARQAYSRSALVCPVSEDLGRAIAALAPGARIRTVPNSVDTDLFAPPAGRQGDAKRPRLIAVGLLTEAKGMAYLLRAIPDLVNDYPALTLDLVGDGPDRSSLEREMRARGLESRVTFHGRQPKERVAELMREADLFVLPSLWENLPCVVIEALATGLPVVASDVGGVSELVTPDRGLLVAPREPAALTASIAEALDRFEGRDPHALAERVAERYGLSATGHEWLDVYRQVSS